MASLFGTARNEHYAASKAALNALMRALAVEHARYGITANAVLPGWIDTEMTEGLQANDKFMGQRRAAHPYAALRQAGRFRWHRGLLDERGIGLPHGRLHRHRRWLQRVLDRGRRRSTCSSPAQA